MDWNPLAWLQQYSWKARLFKWGLCLACVVAECIITESCASHGYHGEWTAWQEMLLRGLGVAFTFVGVNGFLREKETGVLELILVTPLSANQIIFGRAWGLWEQFLPAALASGGSYFALIVLTGFDLGNWFDFCLAVCGFLSMPVFTTYFALCVKNVIGAAVLTWGALFCVYVIAEVLHYFLDRYFQGYMPGSDTLDLDLIWFPISIVAATFALTLPIYFRLRRNLSRRMYSF
jgi:ABC-type Na+ efflux pump permease subunit